MQTQNLTVELPNSLTRDCMIEAIQEYLVDGDSTQDWYLGMKTVLNQLKEEEDPS